MTRNYAPRMYVLGGHDGRTPIREHDLMRFGEFLEGSERLLFHTGNNDVRVSTVFLGLDHNFLGKGRPILFETMVFGGPFNQEMERYYSYDEAEFGHRAWVARVFPMVQSSV